MGKATPDAVLDKMADYILGAADKLYVCSGEPANYAGIAAVALADVAIDSSDFTKGNGDVSGRKVTVGAQSAVPIDSSGTATHVVLAKDAATSELLYVTTCTSQALTAAGTVTVPAWDIEVADPA
jgi:hypothetical protein